MSSYKKRRGDKPRRCRYVNYSFKSPRTNPRTIFSSPNGICSICSVIHAMISSLVCSSFISLLLFYSYFFNILLLYDLTSCIMLTGTLLGGRSEVGSIACMIYFRTFV
nr:MAG TPA: hypothetical protein [Caudoviricetes sp.]